MNASKVIQTSHKLAVTVNLKQPKQKIDILGGDMERSAEFLLKAANPVEIINWYFKDIPLEYMRVAIDKKQELIEGLPKFDFYDEQIKVMKLIKKANPKVKFWATLKTDYDGYGRQNNMPNWVYTGGGYNGGRYDANAFKPKKYARFLADYLKLMADNGVAIDVLSVSKEWLKIMTPSNEYKTIEALRQRLDTSQYAKVRVPLFNGPAAWGVKQGVRFLTQVKEKDYDSNYAGFSAHFYDGPTKSDWTKLVNIANTMSKPVYNEESNAGGGGPFWGAEPAMERIARIYGGKVDTYDAGLKGELFFELWSRGFRKETRSIYFNRGETGKRGRGYWLTKMFVDSVYHKHYLESIYSDQMAHIKTMAFADDVELTIYVINTSQAKESTSVQMTIEGGAMIGDSAVGHTWHDDTELTGKAIDVILQQANSLEINALSSSISVIRVPLL